MKAFFLYVALGSVLVNVAGNAIQSTAEAFQRSNDQRVERLCAVNELYCRN